MSRVIEREELKGYYPDSETWGLKVDLMTNSQVIAVLIKFRAQKKPVYRKAA